MFFFARETDNEHAQCFWQQIGRNGRNWSISFPSLKEKIGDTNHDSQWWVADLCARGKTPRQLDIEPQCSFDTDHNVSVAQNIENCPVVWTGTAFSLHFDESLNLFIILVIGAKFCLAALFKTTFNIWEVWHICLIKFVLFRNVFIIHPNTKKSIILILVLKLSYRIGTIWHYQCVKKLWSWNDS